MKKRTGKMISLSLAVAMAVTAAPVTALAVDETVLTTAQNAGETGTDTTTVDTKEEEEPATVVAAPVVDEALIAGDAEATLMGTPAPVSGEVSVISETDLSAAVTAPANAAKTIKLAANITLSSPLEITADNITLDGGDYTLQASDTFSGNVLTVRSDGVTLKNLTVDGNNKGGHGIQFYTAKNGTINNVTSINNTKTGLTVNASSVTAEGNIKLENNSWGNVINVGFGNNILKETADSSSLYITDATLIGVDKIYADDGDSERAERNGGTISVTDENNSFIGIGDKLSNPVCFVPKETALTNAKITVEKGGNIFCYEQTTSLKDAIENAESGSTVTLVAGTEYTVNDTIDVAKDITIEGNGATITGDNDTAYSAFNITDGSFEIKNATLTDFGGNVYTKQETAVFYVSAGADSFTADTVTIKNFNRMGISVADGTYSIKNCTIECENDYHAPDKPTLTKGIRIGYAEDCEATGTISETKITGAVVHPDWSASAIEVFYNGNATVDDCTIEGCDYGIWVDNYWYPADPTDLTSSVKVTGNTTITAKNPTDEDNSAIIIYGKNGTQGGEITTDVVIESGTFNGQIKVTDDNESNDKNTITVSGGKFKNAGEQLKDFVAPGSNLKPGSDGGFTVSKKSSGSHKFDNYITVITPKNGEVSVSDDWAYVGDKVTLTVTPDKGYVVDKIEIVDEEGEKLEAKKVDDKDNEYTFKVKNSDVTVTVTFKEEGKKTEETDKEDDKTEETTETPETTTPESTTFSDVNESDWFFKGVEYVVDKGIMSGVSENEFAPSGKLTRAMLVQMLYNMESRPACDAENAFMDVPVGQWYTDAVIWANDAKIVSGMGEGLFAPNMEITREQMVAMLYNYAKYKGYDVTASADLSAFADTASVSAWAQPAMQWAVAEGYISGMGDSQLAPQGTATRAEIASVIMRFMEATAESAETAE
ncbi:S-layer homology domain-containing protein [Anaerotignum lactatifermentans]|uniref:S-layer homology domain-containing protein n=1 Tax=Anaerotignum lactatifermentans TaxID=160404 RepID=UPI003AB643EC